MKKFITTTLVAAMMSTSAMAAAHIKPLQTYDAMTVQKEGDFRASDLIGKYVYATVKEGWDSWDWNSTTERAEGEWDNIGDVNDVILGRDGSVKAVIVGVGGFLGLGEKDVALQMSDLKLLREDTDSNDFFVALQTDKANLEAAPAYKAETTMAAKKVSEEAEEKTDDTAMAEKTDETKTAEMTKDAEGRTMLRTPMIDSREGYRDAEPEQLTAEKLTGTVVYSSKDENIGEISKLLMSTDGKIERVVLDIGGFLGLGEHQVAVTMDELKLIRSDDGDDFRAYIDATKEELEAQPEFEG